MAGGRHEMITIKLSDLLILAGIIGLAVLILGPIIAFVGS
jgi:hypothetical protein